MRGHDEFEQRLFTAGEHGVAITLQHRGDRFLLLPFGVLRRKGLHAVNPEEELRGRRLCAPERAVVVEDGTLWR